jgi:high-affinity Fe2+/Pb2+ permease
MKPTQRFIRKMKLVLRFFIKILCTPFFVLFIAGILTVGGIWIFKEWLFEDSEEQRAITKLVLRDFIYMFKQWFRKV